MYQPSHAYEKILDVSCTLNCCLFPAMEEDGFVLVKNRRRGLRKPVNSNQSLQKEPLRGNKSAKGVEKDETEICRVRVKVLQYKEELAGSQLLTELRNQLAQHAGLSQLVSYGLGSLTAGHCTMSSRYQLAVLLHMVSIVSLPCIAFDPVFNINDINIMKQLGISVTENNDRGKCETKSKTLFFMPRCPFMLFNNLLWANWKCLKNVVFFGNDLTLLTQQMTDKEFEVKYNFIYWALKCCKRSPFAVSNTCLENVLNNSAFFSFELQRNCILDSEDLVRLEPLDTDE